MSNSTNLNISDIDNTLNAYYQDKKSITHIGKTLKISTNKVKMIIENYGDIYIKKHPHLKVSDNITTDAYEKHLNTKSPYLS